MNANELADELEDWYEGNQINDTDPIPQAATMLRQQQAEIEALKRQVRLLKEEVASWIDDAHGWTPDSDYFERLFK